MTGNDKTRILVVEDETLVAMLVEDMLAELGFDVVGPAARMEAALELVDRETFALALLDINLGKDRSFPVAEALQARGIPFIFATGYGASGVEDHFPGAVVLDKPFELAQLDRAIVGVLETARGGV